MSIDTLHKGDTEDDDDNNDDDDDNNNNDYNNNNNNTPKGDSWINPKIRPQPLPDTHSLQFTGHIHSHIRPDALLTAHDTNFEKKHITKYLFPALH
jgi:hypothetical protein